MQTGDRVWVAVWHNHSMEPYWECPECQKVWPIRLHSHGGISQTAPISGGCSVACPCGWVFEVISNEIICQSDRHPVRYQQLCIVTAVEVIYRLGLLMELDPVGPDQDSFPSQAEVDKLVAAMFAGLPPDPDEVWVEDVEDLGNAARLEIARLQENTNRQQAQPPEPSESSLPPGWGSNIGVTTLYTPHDTPYPRPRRRP